MSQPGSPTSSALEFARENRSRFLAELKAFLRIPSVSTLPEHREDIHRAAEFLAQELKRIGLENVEVIQTDGHPLVYADWLKAAGKPTCLCYGHYDVQPPDPLEEWVSPPFEPVERNGNLYARGAVDDKGQMYMHVKALESLLHAHQGKLPINVRLLFEGEEEVGGGAIARFVREHPDRLRADFALISDTSMFAPELPTLAVSLRGTVYTEIEAVGAATDLHSGMYGGVAPNPLFALCEIIAKLKNPNGHILIPGFYDDVAEPSTEELAAWKRLPFREEEFLRAEVGSSALTGEQEYSVLERLWTRPTLDVHGMPGGFTGEGAKTVIPAKACAKISMRLVPNQNAERIFTTFERYVHSLCPRGITLSVRLVHSTGPVVIGVDNPYVRAADEAMREVFQKRAVFVRFGGSIPIVSDFERSLKIPSVMMGFGLPDDCIHAPNEKFHIANFHRGIESLIHFFGRLGA